MTHPFPTLSWTLALLVVALWWTLALLVVALPAHSDELGAPLSIAGQPLSLRAAVSRALEESYEARVARLERGRADDALEARRGAYWPQLSVSAQAGYSNRQDETLEAIDSEGRARTYGLASLPNDPWLSVVVDQVLLDLKRWRELEREVLVAEVAAITERERRERVAYEVTRRYAELLRAEREAQIAREGLDASVWLDEQAGRLEEAGRVLANERLQVELARDVARMDLRSADAALRSAQTALWLAVDAGPEPQVWPGLVPASMPQVQLPSPAGGDAAEQDEQLLRRAPDLQILELQRRIEEASVSAVRAARYPSLQLRGGYAHYGIKRFDQYTDEAFVFVGMELPLFDGFQNASELAGARKSASVARLRHQSALASKRARVSDLRERLEIAGERLALAERRASAKAEARSLADLQLKSQRGQVGESQQAREVALRDRRAASDLRFRQLELWATLQRELGLLADSITGVE